MDRELQRPLPRRVPQRPPLRQPARSPRAHRGLENRLQRQPTRLRPRRASARRVRGRVDHQPTPSRITTGPLIGSLSREVQVQIRAATRNGRGADGWRPAMFRRRTVRWLRGVVDRQARSPWSAGASIGATRPDPRIRVLLCFPLALASTALAVHTAAPLSAAGARPAFQLAFNCGGSWTATTYDNGRNLVRCRGVVSVCCRARSPGCDVQPGVAARRAGCGRGW